jgi:hypothetical protein
VGRQGVVPPGVTVAPALPHEQPGGGPAYPPPQPWSLNDPSGAGAAGAGLGPDDGAAMVPASRVWTTWEYLGWFVSSQPVRYPFITTGGVAGAGVIFAPTTTILFTCNDINYGYQSGFRVSGGVYCDAACRNGIELSGFALMDKDKTFDVRTGAGGSPLLARPFINFATGLQDAVVITAPGFASGGILFGTSSQLWGAEASTYLNLFRACPGCYWGGGAEFFAGFRFVELKESIVVHTNSQLFPNVDDPPAFGPLPPGTLFGPRVLNTVDSFQVHNDFYGANFGMRTELRKGCWVWTFTGKIAFGVMHSVVDIFGSTTLARGNPLTVDSVRGGVLANVDCDGRERQDRFTVIPEFTLNLGYQITPQFQAFLGYNFMYINNVVRVGDVISPIANPGTIPSRPEFGLTAGVFPRVSQFEWSDFWAQGVQVGFTLRF